MFRWKRVPGVKHSHAGSAVLSVAVGSAGPRRRGGVGDHTAAGGLARLHYGGCSMVRGRLQRPNQSSTKVQPRKPRVRVRDVCMYDMVHTLGGP